MKRVMSILLAAALAAGLTACGSSTSDGTATTAAPGGSTEAQTTGGAGGEKVTLTFSTSVYVEEPHRAAIDKLISRYTELNPNVTVEIFGAGWADYWNNLTTEVLAGNEADIIQVYPENIASYNSLLADGVCVDLAPYISASGITADQLSGQEFCTIDGKTLALANYAWGTTGIFYRKSMLEEKGIDPESIKTQEDFLEACKVFAEDGKYGMGVVVSSHSFVVGEWCRMLARPVSGGLYFLDGEAGPFTAERVNVNSPENVWAAQWWQHFLMDEKGGKPVPDKKDSRELFWNKEVPFNYDGPWFVGMTRERDDALMDDIGLIPSFDVVYEGKTYKPNPTNYPLVTMLSKNCNNPEEAWKFMEWMASDEAQALVADCGMIPSNKAYASTPEYIAGHELEQKFLTFAQENYADLVSDPAIPQQQELSQVMIDATQAMFSEQRDDAKTTLDDAAKQIKEIMNK
ncbi:ABC transporter substrate-binding protein [Lacrimispora indolis]|uniref:ABC transporter substrate-binding protein n=1 Tax=Lacrimispora indolis TaxID=69825 RepID=UPI00041C0890|nr:sugar ABC transporter substrate-binding protein [[Clostridium] methoxybenzovorans]